MSDRLRMTGMYSGMDTESIIQQLVSAKSTKVTNLKNDQKKLEWKQTAWQDLNSKIHSLWGSTLTKLRLSSAYKKKTTTSSDPTKVSITASGEAVNGTQSVKVNKLAKSTRITGAEVAKKKVTNSDGKETEENWEITDKLNKLTGGKTGTIRIKVGDEEIKEIEIDDDMTINGFVGKLKDAGLNASFDTENNRFFISSKTTGKDSNFTINGSEALLNSLGLQPSDNATNTLSGYKKVDGEDSEIELDGVTFTSSSNSYSINGLTINALGVTDAEVSIVTADDYTGIYDTIKDFITEYNELINEMDKLYNADSARKYSMLTNDEKEAMTDEEVETWENTIKGSLLRKDSTLGKVMNSMVNVMMGSYYTVPVLTDKEKESMTAAEIAKWEEDNKKNKLYLADFGIKTMNYFEAEDNKHHEYHIDGDTDDESVSAKEDKLKAAIAKDPEGIANFFSNLCNTMYTTLKDQMGSTDYSSIYKVYNDKQLKKEYEDYNTKIKKAEKELSDYEDRWYDKFSAMETALSKLQSSQNVVSSMLGMG